MNGVWYVSLMTIGVGFLSGRGGVYFIIGGYVCYWILAPSFPADLPGQDPCRPAEVLALGGADFLRVSLFRPLGIGMLIGGASDRRRIGACR